MSADSGGSGSEGSAGDILALAAMYYLKMKFKSGNSSGEFEKMARKAAVRSYIREMNRPGLGDMLRLKAYNEMIEQCSLPELLSHGGSDADLDIEPMFGE